MAQQYNVPLALHCHRFHHHRLCLCLRPKNDRMEKLEIDYEQKLHKETSRPYLAEALPHFSCHIFVTI